MFVYGDVTPPTVPESDGRSCRPPLPRIKENKTKQKKFTYIYIHIHTHIYLHTYIHTHIYIDIYLYTHTHTFTHIYRSRWPPAYGWRVLFKYLIPQMLEAVDYALGMCVHTHTHTHTGVRAARWRVPLAGVCS